MKIELLPLVLVGRTPWSARDALVPLPDHWRRPPVRYEEADQGFGRGPGGPPHHSVAASTGLAGVAGVAAPAAFTGLTADRSLA